MAIVQRQRGIAPTDNIGSLRQRLRRALPAYLFLLPGMLLFIAWTFYPLIYAFVMSFAEWNLIKPSRFIGLGNYARALRDPIFWLALRNTVLYTVITVPAQMVLGLAIALLLDRPLRARAFFRTVYYLPVVTSWVVVSLIFTYLYNGQAGLINWLLRDGLGLIDKNINWLGEPLTANLTIASLGVWKGIGWTMVIFLAGLQSIPPELYEAAAIDGAGPGARFFRITLPLLSPVTFFNLVMQTITGFMVFTQAFIVTGGGPMDTTLFYALYLYRRAFESFQMGYASAMAWVLLLVVALFTAGLFKSSGRWVFYETKEGR